MANIDQNYDGSTKLRDWYPKVKSNFSAINTQVEEHVGNSDNPHKVTKAQVGLSNVDNTSDLNKPISTAAQAALDKKANQTDVDSIKNNTTLIQNSGGGFAGGADSAASMGAAVGYGASADNGGAAGRKAYATSGGAIGYLAAATKGGAAGENAATDVGGAVGANAKAGAGFAGGSGTEAADGGAIGFGANTQSGGSAGHGAQSGAGGAVGEDAEATGGFAGGQQAKSNLGQGAAVGYYAQTSMGGAVGANAYSTSGGAVGQQAVTASGGAAGDSAAAGGGGAVGAYAKTGEGFAGGANAKAVDSNNNGIDAIQLGTGTNSTPKTLQVYSYQLLDEEGKIPNARLNDGGRFIRYLWPSAPEPGVDATDLDNRPNGIDLVEWYDSPGVGGYMVVTIRDDYKYGVQYKISTDGVSYRNSGGGTWGEWSKIS